MDVLIAYLILFIVVVTSQANSKQTPVCPTDMFLRLLEDGTSDCYHCSDCDMGFGERQTCLLNADRQCIPCDNGTFNDGKQNNCRPCQTCDPGWYIKQNCSGKQDSVCEECPDGYFTAKSNQNMCKKCLSCKKRSGYTFTKCTQTSNTVCNCSEGYFFEGGMCLPCSFCANNNSEKDIIEDCKNRNDGHWCRPLKHLPSSHGILDDASVRNMVFLTVCVDVCVRFGLIT